MGRSTGTAGGSVLAALISICVFAPAGALAGTLDQQQTSSSGGSYSIASNGSLAQTFTAGISGAVDQVDLHLGPIGTPTAPVTVQVRMASGGSPAGGVLATQSLPASSIPGTPAFVAIGFASPAPVIAGSQYAIVAFSSAVPNNNAAWSVGGAMSSYAGGGAFGVGTSPPSGAWTPIGGAELAFKTYVVPSPGPPGPTGEQAAAFKKCKKSHSPRKRKSCRKKAKRLPL